MSIYVCNIRVCVILIILIILYVLLPFYDLACHRPLIKTILRTMPMTT
nr:hypothetical protein [Escherichia coli]